MMLRTGRQKRSFLRRGFTLIELLVVLVLVGILIGLTIPRFSDTTRDLQLTNSARNLAKLLTYAQARAIMERAPYQAAFDPAAGRYWLLRPDPEAEAGDEPTFLRIEGKHGRVMTLPSGIDFLFPEQEIRFYPDGTSDAFSIELSSEGHRFILTQGVGYVRMREEKG